MLCWVNRLRTSRKINKASTSLVYGFLLPLLFVLQHKWFDKTTTAKRSFMFRRKISASSLNYSFPRPHFSTLLLSNLSFGGLVFKKQKDARPHNDIFSVGSPLISGIFSRRFMKLVFHLNSILEQRGKVCIQLKILLHAISEKRLGRMKESGKRRLKVLPSWLFTAHVQNLKYLCRFWYSGKILQVIKQM